MVFPFPERKGVYLLTGANGCGKTALLVALCRLGDKFAFTHYKVNSNISSGPKIDAYQNASVTYTYNTDSVVYSRKGVRWTPSPRTKSLLISKFPFVNTLFISTTGMRFFAQDVFNLKKASLTPVSSNIINPMNKILGTNKFDHLNFITVKGKKGRQRQLHRNNKLYVIKETSGNFYSELNFSLGERLLLNTLDLVENIAPRTLLLIDEVELALHPVAQIEFYNYLKEQANKKNLAVVISTHSSSLIKHADNRIYLEKDNTGIVKVTENCYPALILRSVATIEDIKPDFIFFVEDIMAQRYLQAVLLRFLADIKKNLDFKIIYVGPYEQVVSLVQCFPSLNFDKSKVQAFLDKDVEKNFNSWKSKGNSRSEAEDRKYKMFQDNQSNISYLSITPELGMWEWLEQHPTEFKQYFDTCHGVQGYSVERLIAQVSTEELPNKSGNPRNWAKGCFRNITDKIKRSNPLISEKEIVDDIIICYIDHHYDKTALKALLCPILNRKE